MHKRLTIVCFVQLTILFSVEGVSMSITPSSMVVGSGTENSVTRLELRCSSEGTNNNGIYSLDISRRRFTERRYSSLVIIDTIDGITKDPNMPPDIVAKSPNSTGSLSGTSGTLTMTMDGSSITCSDQAEFRCDMSYRLTGIAGSQTAHESTNFTVITAPNDVRIIDALYEENGEMKRLDNDQSLKVGTRIMYRCSANIGSDSNVLISWERSPVMGTSTDFVPYIPVKPTDIVQDPVISTNCSNTRTSSMYYNLTSSDNDGIKFHCKVRSYLRGEWYQPTSKERRTAAVLSGGSAKRTIQAVLSGGSAKRTIQAVGNTSQGHDGSYGANTVRSDWLAIVLGVLLGACVVLVVILSVCLHRYRKPAEELQQNPQNDNLNAYDRLNMTVGHSQTYDMLERNNSDGRVPEANSTYVEIAHNVP